MKNLLRILKLDNERGCFGGGKTPDLPPVPAPTPTPSPAAQPGEVVSSAQSKRKRIDALKRAGMQSNIKNIGGAAGIMGSDADLSSPQVYGSTKKNTLGS